MNDMFWLSDRKIDILEISSLFKSLPCCTIHVYPELNVIQTFTKDVLINFTLMHLNEFGDEEDIQFICEHNIKTVLCISYHYYSKTALIKFLLILSNTYNGWFGSDDEGFKPYVKSSDFMLII